MERTKKDELDPVVEDGHRAKSVGLSSAMHDIRMLASQYESQNQTPDAGESLRLGGVTTMQPQHLLQPKPAVPTERWKGPAFVLLMLLGLSTSALALGLYAGPESLNDPVYFQTFNPASELTPAVTPDTSMQFPLEEARHEMPAEESPLAKVISSPAVSKNTRRSRVSATPKATQKVSKSRSISSAPQEYSTCDEVACLIDSSDACCSQYESVKQEESVLADYKPYRPERSSVMTAMRGIEDEVLECFDAHGESGLASVDFVIAADGRVREVELSQGTLSFRACIREQVRSVSFKPLQAPFKMSFPFRK